MLHGDSVYITAEVCTILIFVFAGWTAKVRRCGWSTVACCFCSQ